MAVEQHGEAERRLGRANERAERRVIGLVVALDARHGVGEAQLAAIDLGAVGDDAGDRAKPAAHPGRMGVDVGRQRVLEHRRVELVGLAVDVDVGARKQRPDQRRAEARPGGEQLVDEAVLRAAQRGALEPGDRGEFGRIVAPAMRRGEYQRRGLRRRPQDLEGRVVWRGCRVGDVAHLSSIGALNHSGLDHNRAPVTPPPPAWSGGACKAAGFGITSGVRDAADRRGAAEGA